MNRFKKFMAVTALSSPLIFTGASKAYADNLYKSPEHEIESKNNYKFASIYDYPIYQSDNLEESNEDKATDYSTEIVVAFWASMLVAGIAIMKKTNSDEFNDRIFDEELIETDNIVETKKHQDIIVGPEDDPNFWPPKELNN